MNAAKSKKLFTKNYYWMPRQRNGVWCGSRLTVTDIYLLWWSTVKVRQELRAQPRCLISTPCINFTCSGVEKKKELPLEWE